MENYILETIAFQLIFLLINELFLKQETFFTYNRIYLLLAPVFALLLPFLQIPALQEAVPAEAFVMLPEVILGQAPATTSSEVITSSERSTSVNWWLIIYLSGVGATLVLFLRKVKSLQHLFSFKRISEDDNVRIIGVPGSRIACTFYNTIFLGENLSGAEKEQILPHELIHVKQKHSLDLLYFELLKIIFWFNPLIYIFRSRIATLHEFIADAGVVKQVERKSYYEQLLNTAFHTKDISFINQFFNSSIIKKRIVMLQKSRSKTISKLKYLVLVPLTLVMLTYVACSDDKAELDKSSGELVNYSYTVSKAGEMNAETKKKHLEYENFLFNNPDYVGLGHINFETGTVTYSVQPKADPVPEGFKELKVQRDGGEYVFYMNLHPKSTQHREALSEVTHQVQVESSNNQRSVGDVPFAVIEEVPVYPGCGDLSSNEAKKECLSRNINEFVNANFDTSLGKELGLTGVNRIYVQFRVNESGAIEIMGIRAPKEELEAEARRVINLLPKMTPGKQKGETVGVLYSLPITLSVAE